MPKGLKNLLTSLSESFGGRNTPNMTSMEDLGMALHEAAVRGNRRRVKRILNTGILIDYPNDTGQTALFCACFEGQAKIVELLLKKGANPNIKCKEGSTPLHAGAFSGNVCIVSQLVAYGGDLRLHDNQQRSVRKWAERQSDNKKKARMLDFLGRIRNLAMTRSGRDLVCEKQSKEFYEQLKAEESHSLMHLFKKTKSQATMSFPQSNIQSLGFGKVYLKPGDEVGAVATIPLVSESQLLHDDEGLTYNNGPFMVCESMKWDKTQLTAKRLHKCPLEGGVVDLLINEYEFMSQLRHPNILLLMGICNTNNMDGMVLLYERVSLGSLYHHIHHLSYEISPGQMLMIMTQLSDGLLFLHQHNLIHCCITSHAVHLVSESVIKLGNMEYMIHNTSHEGSAARTDVTSNRYINAAYNWMSPELMAGEQPSELSDVYSLCVVMWEIINAAVPWGGLHVEDLMSDILELGRCLPLDIDHLGRTLHAVLAAGLSQDLTVRSTVSIARIRLVISHLKKDREDRMKLGASASALNRHWGSANTSLDESHDLCTTDKNASMYSTASTNRDNTSIQATQGSRIGARPTPSPEKSLVSPEKKSGSPEKKPVEGNLTLTPSKSKNITETPKESQQESPSKLSQPDSVPLQIETKPRTSGDLKISPKKAFTSWTLQDDIEIKEMVAQAKMSPLIKAPSKVFSAPRLGAQPFPKDFVRRSLVTSINNLPPKPPRASLSKVVNEKHSEVDQAQSKGKKNNTVFEVLSQPCMPLKKNKMGNRVTKVTHLLHAAGVDQVVSTPENCILEQDRQEHAIEDANFKPASHRQSFELSESPSQRHRHQSDSLLQIEVPCQTGSVHKILPPLSPRHSLTPTGGYLHTASLPRCFLSPNKSKPKNVQDVSWDEYRSERFQQLLSQAYQPQVQTTDESSPERISPRDMKDVWFDGSGSIQDLITDFQKQWEKHEQHQAILCLKSKKKISISKEGSQPYKRVGPRKKITSRDVPTKRFEKGDQGSSDEDCASMSSNSTVVEDGPNDSAEEKKYDLVEEFYFDDEINPNLPQERHLRLEATVNMSRSLSSTSPEHDINVTLSASKTSISDNIDEVKRKHAAAASVNIDTSLEQICTEQTNDYGSEPRTLPPRRESLRIIHIQEPLDETERSCAFEGDTLIKSDDDTCQKLTMGNEEESSFEHERDEKHEEEQIIELIDKALANALDETYHDICTENIPKLDESTSAEVTM